MENYISIRHVSVSMIKVKRIQYILLYSNQVILYGFRKIYQIFVVDTFVLFAGLQALKQFI